MKFVIGITGYTGCGKSFTSKQIKNTFEKNGFNTTILDADFLARKLRDENEDAKKRIVSVLGEEVYDKETGKSIPSVISSIIFGNSPESKAKRVKYEAIFLDLIPKQCNEAIENLQENSVLILDFYLIFSYLASILDKINYFVLITSSPEKQLERLVNPKYGRNVEMEMAKKRIESQRITEPEEIVRNKVNFVVTNDSEDADSLQKQIDILVSEVKKF